MKVSVIIPTYNSSKYLAETVASILKQTFTDFELLLIDDSSTDDTVALSTELAKKDSRIKLLKNDGIKGVSDATNTGIKAAQGEYLALVDSDDISLPGRFEKQVAFLVNNPDVGVVGSFYKEFGKSDHLWEEPTEDADMKAKLIICPSIANPSAMIRKSVLTDNQISYPSEYESAQDYDLWVQLMDVTKFANIPEVLLHYRIHETNISKVGYNKMIHFWKLTLTRLLKRLEIEPTPLIFEVLDVLETEDIDSTDPRWFNDAIEVCQLIKVQNQKFKVFDEGAMNRLMDSRIKLLTDASKLNEKNL